MRSTPHLPFSECRSQNFPRGCYNTDFLERRCTPVGHGIVELAVTVAVTVTALLVNTRARQSKCARSLGARLQLLKAT